MNDWLFQELLANEYRIQQMQEAKEHNRFLISMREKTVRFRGNKPQRLAAYLPLRRRALS